MSFIITIFHYSPKRLSHELIGLVDDALDGRTVPSSYLYSVNTEGDSPSFQVTFYAVPQIRGHMPPLEKDPP